MNSPEERFEQHLDLAGVPIWAVHRGSIANAAACGTILFYHGFGVDISVQAKELASLADAGFLALGVDAVGHGRRRWDDFESRFGSPGPRFEAAFMKVIRETVAEIPALLDELIDSGIVQADRIGIGGISMGGYVTYSVVPLERRIRVAVPLLASPTWKSLHGLRASDLPERFFPVALLAQTAGGDTSVPPHHARRFHQTLQSHYRDAPERLRYVEFPGCDHLMPEAEWEQLWKNVVAWFRRFLADADPSEGARP